MLTQSKKKSILFKQIDNFFEDPQSVVELSQSLDYFGYDDNQGYVFLVDVMLEKEPMNFILLLLTFLVMRVIKLLKVSMGSLRFQI